MPRTPPDTSRCHPPSMPWRPQTPCSHPGCGNLSPCRDHPHRPDPRPSASRRGYGATWQRIRALHLDLEPLCVECFPTALADATEVDHIVPRALWDDPSKTAYLRQIGAPSHPDDDRNLRSLCKTHHSRKTVQQDGGLGRQRALAHQVEWNLGQWRPQGVGGANPLSLQEARPRQPNARAEVYPIVEGGHVPK